MDPLMTEARRVLATSDLRPMAKCMLRMSWPLAKEVEDDDEGFDRYMEAGRLFSFCSRNFPVSLCCKLCKLFEASLSHLDCDEAVKKTVLCRLQRLLRHFQDQRISLLPSVLQEIESIFLACLKDEDISASTFKSLSSVVTCGAASAFTSSSEFRKNLLNYIPSAAGTDFSKAICIFLHLSIEADHNEEELKPVLEALLPEILARISDNQRYNAGDSDAAFRAAFTLAVKISRTSAETAQTVAYALVKAMKEMLKDGREEYVRQMLKYWRIFVLKDFRNYKDEEYTFVKEFISMIVGIEGLRSVTKGIAQGLLRCGSSK